MWVPPAAASLALPRSVLLAFWVQHVGAGSEPLRRAIAAVQGDDEPHDVRGPVDVTPVGGQLPDLLAEWASGPRESAALLPAPGDVMGLPAAINATALAAGECVLVTTPLGSFAAVPDVQEFGSIYEIGHLVSWTVSRVPAWRGALLGTVGSLADSERDLRAALVSATEALAALDVARWRPEAAASIAALRSDVDPGWSLPPGLDGRRIRVLVMAARLRAIVALATDDDGGAINLWQADQRSTALREVDRAARRALCAATVQTDVPQP